MQPSRILPHWQLLARKTPVLKGSTNAPHLCRGQPWPRQVIRKNGEESPTRRAGRQEQGTLHGCAHAAAVLGGKPLPWVFSPAQTSRGASQEGPETHRGPELHAPSSSGVGGMFWGKYPRKEIHLGDKGRSLPLRAWLQPSSCRIKTHRDIFGNIRGILHHTTYCLEESLADMHRFTGPWALLFCLLWF